MLFNQIIENRLSFKKIIGGSMINEFPIVKNQNSVIMNNGVQSMCYSDDSGLLKALWEKSLYFFVSFRVYIGCGFIHEKNFRVGTQSSGNTNELFLAVTDVVSFAIYFEVEFILFCHYFYSVFQLLLFIICNNPPIWLFMIMFFLYLFIFLRILYMLSLNLIFLLSFITFFLVLIYLEKNGVPEETSL